MTNKITDRKLRAFADLPNGWYYGEGVPFGGAVLNMARTLSLGLAETDAFPGLNGEVVVSVYFGEHYLEFTIDPDESIALDIE